MQQRERIKKKKNLHRKEEKVSPKLDEFRGQREKERVVESEMKEIIRIKWPLSHTRSIY